MPSEKQVTIGAGGQVEIKAASGKTAPAKAPQNAAPKPKTGEGSTAMRALRVTKVTVNIGVGQAGDRLEKAEKVLAALTQRKPVRTTARESHRDWQVREGQPIGVKVTLRGPDAVDFAKRALWTRNFRVADWSFDREGNLNFGIPDHTQFEGQKYNPEIGVFGMDVAVTVERPGFRVKHRANLRRSLPRSHRVTRDESKTFLKQLLGLEIL